jgi:hypothetical protein
VKPSFVEQICNAYSDGMAAGLRNDSARPHQGDGYEAARTIS